MIRKNKNNTIIQKLKSPKLPRLIAQGNKKEISISKMINKMATK